MIRTFVTLLLVVNYQTTFAQSYLSLQDAQIIMEKNNLQIKQSELMEKVAKINYIQTQNNFLPHLNLGINSQNTMGLNFDQITGQLITGNQWSNLINTTASTGIVIYQGSRNVYEVRSSILNVDISELETQKLKLELEIQLVTLYFQTLINLDLHAASIAQYKLSEQQLNEEKIKLEIGRSTLVDVTQAQNKLANDQLNSTSTKNAYELGLLRLQQLLNINQETEIQLAKPKEDLYETTFYPHLSELNQDPYIQILDKSVKVAEIGIKIARSGYFPTITLNSSYSTNYSSRRFKSIYTPVVMPLFDQFNINRSFYISIGVTYNLFDKFATRSNVAKSRLNLLHFKLEKDRVVKERQHILDQARKEYLAAIEEYNAVKIAYEARKVTFEAMSERYDMGKSSSLDLYRSMTDYNIAEFNTITAKYLVMLKREILRIYNK